MVMVLGDILVWWYSAGLRQQAKGAGERLDGILDYFSIGLLLGTLFAPFRQISAGGVDGPLEERLRGVFDQLISRAVGAVARLIIMGIGVVTLLFSVLLAGIWLLVWTLLPLLPIIGIVLFLIGWLPWNR